MDQPDLNPDPPPLDLSESSPRIARVYTELRQIAARHLGRENPGHSLQPTELVHEAYVKLCRGRADTFDGRTHFMAVAARAMRQILVDHARRKNSIKRKGGTQLEFDESLDLGSCHSARVLDVDRLIERLKQVNTRVGQIVELRVFGGLTIKELTEVLGLSHMTVSRDWRVARAWIAKELGLSAED